LPVLFSKMFIKYGCQKKDIQVGIFGGAVKASSDIFHIGERNLLETKDFLTKMGYSIKYYNVGGHISRTIYMNVVTGNITLITQPIML
jgi:chemotaxis receptor (MCP) glutamine deamidase CheD